MRVILVLAEDEALRESIRASWSEQDLLLFEGKLDAAARRLVSLQADAILLDDAPGLGVEAIEPLKALAPGTPIIALTARADASTEAAFLRAGGAALLAKPFSCDKLISEMDRLTARPQAPANQSAVATDNAGAGNRVVNQHQMALRWLSRVSGQTGGAERLAQILIDASVDVFDVTRSAVVLELDGLIRVVASQGIPESVTQALRLSFASGLMRWFDEHACLFDRQSVEASAPALAAPAAAAVKEMRLLNAWLGAPLVRSGQVVGALLLGEKASGTPYSAEERELLTLVTRCVSIVFERAQVHAGVLHEQGKLDNILASINAGVVAISAAKTISMMNQGAERLLKVRAADLIGKSVQKLGSAFADVTLRTLADGKPRLRQEIRDPAAGATLGLSATPLGREGVVVVFSELTAETLNTQELADSPIWGYLAARVAQEIKNPMVAINTFAQLLPKKYDSPDFRDAFGDVVQREVARINAVVETLFTFAENVPLKLEPADLTETVQHVLDGFHNELDAHAIRIEAQFDAGTAVADLDTGQFSAALANVVRNSIDAMPDGGTLRVRTLRENGVVEVLVSDTGPGVPREDAAMVFAPFFGTRERGMGLGLAIAGQILKGHKGELKLVHTEDGASSFALRVPVTRNSDANRTGR